MKLHALTFLIILAVSVSASADVTLPRVLGSGMVLQRGLPVPVWGWAEAGEKVTVSFAGQSKAVKAGGDGKWMVKLAPLQASAKAASDEVVRRGVADRDRIAVGVFPTEVDVGSHRRCRDLPQKTPQRYR